MVQERRLAFGSVAELYDRSRPSYPSAVVDDVLAFCCAPSPRMLELGAGTGKATALFAPRVASLVAIEPDASMAAIARRNCERFPAVSFEQVEFERWMPDGLEFELVACAQAWHWMKRDVRTRKARAVLVDGGALALFWSRPMWDTCAIADDLRRAYGSIAPFGPRPGPMHPAQSATEAHQLWGDYERELDDAAGFEPEGPRRYGWTEAYTTSEYLDLIQTHSDHIVLGVEELERLLAAVGAAIESVGGSFALDYVTYLWLARAT